MNARFELCGPHATELIVEPSRGIEAMLMAAFLRYDSNVFSVSVERYEDGQIKAVTFIAGVVS